MTEPIQFLTPEGRYEPSPSASSYAHHVAHLDTDSLLRFYREMTLTRKLDDASTALQRQGQLALWIPSYGQEAAQTGSAHALRPLDTVFPSYREHGVALARGIDFVDILAVLRGTTFRGWDQEKTRFRLYTIVLAAQALHAAGYAMGIHMDQKSGRKPHGEEAVIAYIGDGAMSEGDASEALIFARTYNAPVLFFVQNNRWAISTPSTTQTPVSYADRAEGFGIPGYEVDGNDILASYAVTREVMNRVRDGGGPALIEAQTYRLGPHTSSDDPTKYRSAKEYDRWLARDPIQRLRAHLAAQGVTENVFEDIDENNAAHAMDVRQRLLALPDPSPERMFEHVYSEPHPVIAEQQRWITAYERSFTAPES